LLIVVVCFFSFCIYKERKSIIVRFFGQFAHKKIAQLWILTVYWLLSTEGLNRKASLFFKKKNLHRNLVKLPKSDPAAHSVRDPLKQILYFSIFLQSKFQKCAEEWLKQAKGLPLAGERPSFVVYVNVTLEVLTLGHF
jgi:hypothetical protein